MSISPSPLTGLSAPPSPGWSASWRAFPVLATLLLVAAAPPSPHDQVLRLLASSETLPREADWAPLGPAALPELLSLIGDPNAPEAQRTRAVAALAVVSEASASQRLQELLLGQDTPTAVRVAATLALGRREGLRALPVLTPLLSDSSPRVRIAVAQTLGRMGGAETRQALESRLSLEEEPDVREALQQGLSYLEP
jgi:HEAT repeat protein